MQSNRGNFGYYKYLHFPLKEKLKSSHLSTLNGENIFTTLLFNCFCSNICNFDLKLYCPDFPK